MVQYLKKFESFERKKFSTCPGRYFGLKCHLRIIHVSASSVTFEVLIQGEVIITFNFEMLPVLYMDNTKEQYQ